MGEKKSELGLEASYGQRAERRRMQRQREVSREEYIKGWREKLTHREGENGVLIFSASTFGSAEPPQSQFLSDWPGLQRVVD